ncbi:MAG TPA: S41 family peptidase [Blastocatellia bacterium]|nr:S41 family peptidase [Blastocatellia bacterium]
MRFKTKIAIVVFSTVIAFYAIVGSFMSKSGQVVARGSQYGQLQIFDEVLSHIIRDYVDQPDLEKVRIGSLRGLAEGLDPYSAYLSPEQVKQYDPKLNRGETGMILSKVGGYAYIVSVLKGSPAEQAGARAGDFIEYVGKVPSRDLSLYDIEQILSGQPGTTVEVRILHQGQSRKVNFARAKLTQPGIEARTEEPGIGYLKITSLAEGKAAEVKTQLNDLVAKGAQKIVLDLRGAANGKLQEGVAVANLFVGSGTLARVLGKADKETQAYSAEANKVVFTGPLAVVVDRSTAGPAEVIAAAVRDQKRGELVGERSFGAGSEQQMFSLSDGGALLITIAKYAPAAGKPFMEEPINPTVKVDRPVEAETILPDGDDDDDAEAEKPETQVTQPPKPAPPVEDVQLKKAVEILRQTTAKAQAAKRAANQKAPAAVPFFRDPGLAT